MLFCLDLIQVPRDSLLVVITIFYLPVCLILMGIYLMQMLKALSN